jgi:hypothetical protein
VGIWIERAWASVAADNLRSYVRDSDPKSIGTKAVVSEYTMAYIEKTESEEHKAALYQEAEGLLMMSLAGGSTLS